MAKFDPGSLQKAIAELGGREGGGARKKGNAISGGRAERQGGDMINATPTPIDGQAGRPPSPFYAPITIKSTDSANAARPSSLPHLRVQRRQSCERGEDNDGNVLQHSLMAS